MIAGQQALINGFLYPDPQILNLHYINFVNTWSLSTTLAEYPVWLRWWPLIVHILFSDCTTCLRQFPSKTPNSIPISLLKNCDRAYSQLDAFSHDRIFGRFVCTFPCSWMLSTLSVSPLSEYASFSPFSVCYKVDDQYPVPSVEVSFFYSGDWDRGLVFCSTHLPSASNLVVCNFLTFSCWKLCF